MIKYVKGDLFSTPDKLIAHGCNAQQVMASGVAKQVNEKYPKAFKDYYSYIERVMRDEGRSTSDFLGTVIASEQPDGKTILNCITQDYYGRNVEVKFVSYDAVDKALRWIGEREHIFGNKLSMPKIGAGLGGGDWRVIEAIINSRLPHFEVTVYHLD